MPAPAVNGRLAPPFPSLIRSPIPDSRFPIPEIGPFAIRIPPCIVEPVRQRDAGAASLQHRGGRSHHMEAAILAWLQDVAIRAFGISLFLLLAIDAGFAVVLLATRDRGIVNRWTARVLAAN